MEEQKKTYTGWIVSDSFWKRSLAVYGYSVVGSILCFIAFFTVYLLVVLLIATFGLLFS